MTTSLTEKLNPRSIPPEIPNTLQMSAPTNLRSFLDTYRAADTTTWNLTGMGKDVGKYNVPDDKYDELLECVQQHIFGPRPQASSLLERHLERGPWLGDLDFRYAGGGPLLRRFEARHIRDFVAETMAAIIYFCDFEDFTAPLCFYSMTKPTPESEKGNQKDGVHLQAPAIVTHPKFQFAIRGFLLDRGIIERVFGSTEITNSAVDCYDVSVINRNNWFLYGACKPDKAQYAVRNCWRITPDDVRDALAAEIDGMSFDDVVAAVKDLMDEDNEEDMLASLPAYERSGRFLKLFSIRHGVGETNTPSIRAARQAEWDELVKQWGAGKKSKVAERHVSATADYHEGTSTDTHFVVPEGDDVSAAAPIRKPGSYTADDIAFAFKIARQCLNPDRRAASYDSWVDLGTCLRNISNTDDAFRVWMEISRRVSGYDGRMTDSEYRTKWGLLPSDEKSRRIQMGSLIYWAREDAPKTLEAIQSETHRDWIINFAKDTHVNVASFVFRLYQHEFRCSVGSKRGGYEWFQFVGHSWKHLKTPNELRRRLSAEVRNHFIEADRELGRRIQLAINNESEAKFMDEKRKKVLQIERQLEMATFKDQVLKECGEKFYDEEFLSLMNCNSRLLGVANGVLELRWMDPTDNKFKVRMRNGLPEDYISFQMGRGMPDLEAIPYIPWEHVDPAHKRGLEDFFAKIYPQPEVRRYKLVLLASCLEGANHEQQFYVDSGHGGNGKSMIQILVAYTFGDYHTSLATTALTRPKPPSGAPNPDMVPLKCRRIVSMGEPDQGEKVNTSKMKQMSGDDIIEARPMFGEMESFRMMGKLILACNDLPPVPSTGYSEWRRIKLIPHISTFPKPGDPTDPTRHIYPRDPNMVEKLRLWRTAFLSMLVEIYRNDYLVNGLIEPRAITDASNKYREENDTFQSFFQMNFVVQPGAGPVSIATIMDLYKDWKQTEKGRIEVKRKEMIDRFKGICDKRSTEREFWGIRPLEEGEYAGAAEEDLLAPVV